MKRFLLGILILLLVASCSATEDCSEQDVSCTRVLFIGNSLTYVNDLPNMFAQLAKAGKHKVQVSMYAPGGWAFEDHVESAHTANAINSQKWTYVVLQEQSQRPAVHEWRINNMYPAARTLVTQVRNMGATPLFYLTWARRDGFPEYGMPGYESMQAEVNNGYYGIAQELGVTVVPVGGAWFTAFKQHPGLSLWQDDGNHPTEQGTYLAACVFYAVIFKESPVGVKYHANLSAETAEILQNIAAPSAP